MRQLTEREGRDARQSCDERWRHAPPPPLDFHGAGGKGHHPWLCQRARSSGMGVDGPQAEERAMAADAHCIAQVPCDEFLFFVFLAEALKKNKVCPVVEKRSRQIPKLFFYLNRLILLRVREQLRKVFSRLPGKSLATFTDFR
jgi:hypothetical protein